MNATDTHYDFDNPQDLEYLVYDVLVHKLNKTPRHSYSFASILNLNKIFTIKQLAETSPRQVIAFKEIGIATYSDLFEIRDAARDMVRDRRKDKHMDFRRMTLNEKLNVLETVRKDRDERNMLWEEIMEKHDISLSRAKQLYNEGMRSYWRRDNKLWLLVVKHCGNMQSDIATRIWNGLMRAGIITVQGLAHTDEIHLLRIRGIGKKYRSIILDMKKGL